MRSIPLLLLFTLLLGTSARAQKNQDLRQDSTFFEQQAALYQAWLDDTGIGQYLRYRELDVGEQELAIYLEFKTSDLDLIVNQWTTLKEGFEEQSAISLEQQLFYKAANLMEVRQSALSVQVYDTYDLRKEPLFSRVAYFEDGRVQVEESNPKSPIKPIQLMPRAIGERAAPSTADFQAQLNREKAYECILDYARERYENAGYNGKLPEIRVLEDEENLRFEIIDLRLEVLKGSNVLCPWLEKRGYNCPWAKRELLTFLFTYLPSANGVVISGDIDGKVGSGLYANVERGGYLSMEKDYDETIKSYIDAFTVELKNRLRNCQ
ncbi:hypothetical protein [Lewinella sp. W8]|uniref:hypothetical protein n=1 Tax=Lewinella sp. W8 TaxID=2528208 RepID=UPI00106737FF|nr:hypothetical protein [Lewinella sp. W8]MTB52770.1 hypothetical protein [Lewinella sp. W8]